MQCRIYIVVYAFILCDTNEVICENDKKNHDSWNRFDLWSLLEFPWFQLTATSIGSDNVLAPTRRQSHCLNGWRFCLLTRVWVSEVQWVKRVLVKSNTTVVLKRTYVPREPDKTIPILLSSLKTYVLHRYAFRYIHIGFRWSLFQYAIVSAWLTSGHSVQLGPVSI